MIVVVIDVLKDSLIKRRTVFLRLDVKIAILYRPPKSFNPDVILRPAADVVGVVDDACGARRGERVALVAAEGVVAVLDHRRRRPQHSDSVRRRLLESNVAVRCTVVVEPRVPDTVRSVSLPT